MAERNSEVEDVIKEERLTTLWRRYGRLFIWFLVLIVVGTAAKSAYKHFTLKQKEQQTAALTGVIEKQGATVDDYLAVNSETAPFADLLRLQALGAAESDADIQAVLDTHPIDADASHLLEKYAAYATVGYNNAAPAQDQLEALSALTADHNPWRYYAHLDSALLEANVNKNYAKAIEHLTLILNADFTPETLDQKARSLKLLYDIKAAQ